ncbi:linear amide C-N hydrolase [Agromyces aerolatus]|uniref:linear amide C-N hydrolase n=1 Tax=Agromyces sp. LY-1074 TaxID=3074080 RepID=UPI00285A5A52|nr:MULTISPECIES: linear amide C-N hydrolase [unclassified Agromyces]MDR5700837.1 linear amide C-N hydrolase [Agromyces sp. LY-1074]MDR5707358.1 linear amide C-N hydrolase [Agromyces sp. LY-1358]
MCTSLQYTDLNGLPYFGRTLELDIDEPWVLAYVPPGVPFESEAPGGEPVKYAGKYGFIAVTAPARMPSKEAPLTQNDLKVIEGLNSEGVTFSLLAYPSSGAPGTAADNTIAALQAWDLGSWVLSQSATVEEVKAALKEQAVFLTRIALVGNAVFPFHLVVHDATGASIVIEWHDGIENVYDNPVGVMTNGPTFPWHLTNLGNWTHLSNVDASSATFGTLDVHQPDSGIATVALPSSNTSVDRFIRAVYYSNFVEKVEDADTALLTLSRIMDNFDRPRGATTSPPQGAGGEGVKFQGIDGGKSGPPTEYTVWTNMSDLKRKKFFFRSYDAFNWTSFDLDALAEAKQPRVVMTHQLSALGGDGTQALLEGAGV